MTNPKFQDPNYEYRWILFFVVVSTVGTLIANFSAAIRLMMLNATGRKSAEINLFIMSFIIFIIQLFLAVATVRNEFLT